MFRCLFFVCFLCFSTSSWAQSSFFLRYTGPATAITQQPVWTMDNQQNPVVATSVYRAGKTNPHELALLSLDRLGRIKWQISYQSENRDLLISDIKTGPDNGIYVAGMWGLQMSSLPKPFIAAFDDQGRFKWSKFIPTALVDSRVKLACRANEIGLGFTVVNDLNDFIFYRFDYAGNQRGALRIGGVNSEDILVDLQLLPNGNFAALVETSANSLGQRNAGIILFNPLSGISSSFQLQGTSNSSPYQLSSLPGGELGIGLLDAQGYQWLQLNTNGQNLRTAYTIDSILNFQQYRTGFVQGNFVAQGPIGNGQGTLELVQRGQSDASWSLFATEQLYSGQASPLSDVTGNVYMLATAAGIGPEFSEQLIYIKTNSALELCYEQKNSTTKAGQPRNFTRINFAIQAGNLMQPSVALPWSAQTLQFTAKTTDCNTIRNAPLLPTAFSPNNDGLNESFGPAFAEFPSYTLRVYDRWGTLLFEGENKPWDGTKSSTPVGVGRYPYVFDYTDTRGRISRITGELTLLR